MIRPGKLLYNLYYRPKEIVQNIVKTGLRRTMEIKAGQKEMILASGYVKELTYPGKETYNVYFLTGKKYWFQTAFCLHSLQKYAGLNIHAYILDDGSFDEALERQVLSGFPTTTSIIRTQQINQLLDRYLPENQYPVLRQRRIIYPHLRKLTDVHVLPGDRPKLVLDSDMLFFRQPEELLKWLNSPDMFLFMRDVSESYGYSNQLMKKLTGAESIPERLNVGVAGIDSEKIDWKKLEHWTDELLKTEGSSYLQEQALTAMIASNESHRFLNEKDYKVLPAIKGATVPEILHHYVAEAKYDYFVKGWKYFI